MSRRLADPQVVGALREILEDAEGIEKAIPLADLANFMGVHSRRVTEAVSFLQAWHYPVGSVAGIGIWKIKDESERQRAIRPEARRLASIAVKLHGLGFRDQARDLRQLALSLAAVPGTEASR